MKKKVLFLVLNALCPLWALAQFSGNGSGTAEDPYQITNADELYQVRSHLSAKFILMNDIDLTDWLEENNPTNGWAPIGTNDAPFKGTLDGNGKTIKFFVNRTTAGLFGYGKYAKVRNLNLIADITATEAGSLFHYCSDVTISNCTFRGNIIARGMAGGIAAKSASCTITESSVSGTITGTQAGGIVANSFQNSISLCSVWATITNPSTAEYSLERALGGIVGYDTNNLSLKSYISNCYFNGKIFENHEALRGVGGICGYASQVQQIDHCVVVSQSIKGYYAKGIGNPENLISNVVIVDSLQYVKSYYRVGGASTRIGTSEESLALSSMIVIKSGDTSGTTVQDGEYDGTGIGTMMMKKGVTYTSHGFDMNNVWTIVEGKSYPYLRCAAEFMSTMDGSQNIPVEETDVSSLTDAVYANPVTVSKGSTATLTINLKNAQTTNGYSFDLKLPTGVTLAKDNSDEYVYTLSTRHNGHVATVNYKEASGVYGFAVMSLSSKDVKESYGAILTLTLIISDEMAEGDYAVKVQNARYSLSSGATSVAMEDVTSLLTVENYTKGDANGDSMVDIADAVCIVNHIVGKATPSFIEAAADANGDGVVDIADAVRIVNLIVGKIDALGREHEIERNLPEPE